MTKQTTIVVTGSLMVKGYHIYHMGLVNVQNVQIQNILCMPKVGLYSPLIYSVVYNDSVNWQRRP